MNRFAFAERLDALERLLVEELKLEPLPLPQGLAHLEGRFKDAPARVDARAFTGAHVRHARIVQLRGDGLEIANLLCLAKPEHALPILGVDLVGLGGDHAIAVADLSALPGERPVPIVLPPHGLPSAGALPDWSRRWFSPDALFVRVSTSQSPQLCALLEPYARAFITAVHASIADAAGSERVLAAQDAYALSHLEHDRGLRLLEKIFEPSAARAFLTEVMFPLAQPRRASTL